MNNDTEQKATDANVAMITLITVEYTTLRDEIIKRVELGYQVISLTLVVVGAFLSVGLQSGIPASVLLVYPLIAFFLSAGWAHNDMRIRQIATYIRELETKTGGLGWGRFVRDIRARAGFLRLLGIMSASGVFIGTQLISLLLALFKITFTATEWTLLVIDTVAIIMTFIILRRSEGWK